MIYKLQFWTLIAGLLAFVVRYFYPDTPIDTEQILAGVLFVLGLIGVVPSVRAAIAKQNAIVPSDIFKSKAFWTLVVGVAGFVIRYYAPTFPYTDAVILGVVIFVLNHIGINPELRQRYLLDWGND